MATLEGLLAAKMSLPRPNSQCLRCITQHLIKQGKQG